MPARQKPVSARSAITSGSDEATKAAASVQPAAASAQARNTRRAAKRSDTASSANTSVPTMKPICSDELSVATAAAPQPNARSRSGITALTANQGEVPSSCATTITGSTRRGAAPAAGGTADGTGGRVADIPLTLLKGVGDDH